MIIIYLLSKYAVGASYVHSLFKAMAETKAASLQSVLGARKKSSRTEPRATGFQASRGSGHPQEN